MSIINSFRHAINGLIFAFSHHTNLQIHTFFALIAVVMGWWLGLSQLEWLIILFTIVLVFIAEMVNTAIESMTDLITVRYSRHAKAAKDVAAGMVLVTAISALIVAAAIFLPYLINLK